MKISSILNLNDQILLPRSQITSIPTSGHPPLPEIIPWSAFGYISSWNLAKSKHSVQPEKLEQKTVPQI